MIHGRQADCVILLHHLQSLQRSRGKTNEVLGRSVQQMLEWPRQNPLAGETAVRMNRSFAGQMGVLRRVVHCLRLRWNRMFKVMMLLKRKTGLSLEEFILRYEGEHVPLAEKHASRLHHYSRHYLHPGSHVLHGDIVEEPAYDVITELWYDDRAAFEEQQQSLRARPETVAAVVADEETLFDRSKSRTVYVEDHVSDLVKLLGEELR
jgi:EthD domain